MRFKRNAIEKTWIKIRDYFTTKLLSPTESHPLFCLARDTCIPYTVSLAEPFQVYVLYAYSEFEEASLGVAAACVARLFPGNASVLRVVTGVTNNNSKDPFFSANCHLFCSAGETVFSNADDTEKIVLCPDHKSLVKWLGILGHKPKKYFEFDAYAYNTMPPVATFVQAKQFLGETHAAIQISLKRWPDSIIFAVNPKKIREKELVAIATAACESQGESMDSELLVQP